MSSLQLESALAGKKSSFENVNFNWNLTLEDSFVDLSDDELVDEKVHSSHTASHRHLNTRLLTSTLV